MVFVSRRCGSSKLSKGGIFLKLFVSIGEAEEGGVYLSTYLRGQLPRIGLGIDLCRGRWWAAGVQQAGCSRKRTGGRSPWGGSIYGGC